MSPPESPADLDTADNHESQQPELDARHSAPPKFDPRANYESLLTVLRETDNPWLWRFFT